MDLAAIEALYPDHVAHQRKVYADAMREVGCDAVLIHSGMPLKNVSNDDQYWPVRPTPFLSFRAEAFGLWQGTRAGVALGPVLSGWITLFPRLRVGLLAAGTRALSRIDTRVGTAGLMQELFALELELALGNLGDLKLSVAAGSGVMLLQADGKVPAPRSGVTAFQWTWMVSAGPRLSYWLSKHWSLTAAVNARLYMPDVVVAVLTEETRLGRPSIDAALGVSFSP